ncbi:hypothetical protein Tco_0914865, partial [Tanacetum coccineum]
LGLLDLNPRRDSLYVMGFPIGSTIWALEARIDVAMAYSSWVWSLNPLFIKLAASKMAQTKLRDLTVTLPQHIKEGLNFSELATMKKVYTGSDLKTLCTTAAYRPVKELIQQERLKDIEKKHMERAIMGELRALLKEKYLC